MDEDKVLKDLLAELAVENEVIPEPDPEPVKNLEPEPKFFRDDSDKAVITSSGNVSSALDKLKAMKEPRTEKPAMKLVPKPTPEPAQTPAKVKPKEVDARVLGEAKPTQVKSTTTTHHYSNPNLINDIQELFVNTTHELIKNSRLDRMEIQETIDHIKDGVFNNNKTPSQIVSSLVEAHGIKASINTNMIKILDSMSRFTTANKSGMTSKDVTVSNEELTKLLDS